MVCPRITQLAIPAALCVIVSVVSVFLIIQVHHLLVPPTASKWRELGFSELPPLLLTELVLPRLSCTTSQVASAGCPFWLAEYISFHREWRGKPGAKYLVYSCTGGIQWCGGIGDRLNGILFLLRIANFSRRVLLIDWDKPFRLEHFMEPVAFDWRVTPDISPTVYAEPRRWATNVDLCWHTSCEFRVPSAESTPDGAGWQVIDLQRKDLEKEFAEVPAVAFVTTNPAPVRPIGVEAPPTGSAYIRCLAQATMRFSSAVLQNAEKHERRVFAELSDVQTATKGPSHSGSIGNSSAAAVSGRSAVSFAALHLRLGGSAGEKRDANREERFGRRSDEEVATDSLHRVRQTLRESSSDPMQLQKETEKAGSSMAQEGGEASEQDPKLIVVSDSPWLQSQLERGRWPGCITTGLPAVHVDKVRPRRAEDLLPTFVELAILSRSSRLFWGPSGFAVWAAAFGTQPLSRVQIDAAKEAAAAKEQGEKSDYGLRMGFRKEENGMVATFAAVCLEPSEKGLQNSLPVPSRANDRSQVSGHPDAPERSHLRDLIATSENRTKISAESAVGGALPEGQRTSMLHV